MNFSERLEKARRIAALFFSVFVLALGMTGLAQAADNGETYVGTLGKAAVVVHLYKNGGNQLVGTYFYRSKGRDIGLVAQSEKGQYVECPLHRTGEDYNDAPDEPEACDKPLGYWKLSITGDAAVGTWSKTPDFKTTLAIQLKDSLKFDYDLLRAEGPTSIVKGSGEKSADGAIAWHFVREERSGASMPQLTKAPNASAMQDINQELGLSFGNDIIETLTSNSYSYHYKVAFANKNILVIDREGCKRMGGGALRCEWSSMTYDLAAGKAIDWRDFIRFPTVSPFDYKEGKDFVSLVLRTAKREANDCLDFDNDLDCKGSVCSSKTDWRDFWYGQLSPRQEGMFVAFPFNHGPDKANCVGEGITLPWSKVRPLLLKPLPW